MTHTKSGNQLVTDAPIDNNGKGEAFSPTDLVAAGLISCMVTVMGIHADRRGLNMGNVRGFVEKTMVNAPRRIAQLNVRIEFFNHSLSTPERQSLETIAINCPVAASLSPEIVQQTRFIYD
ncbi:MAG TPA: OsmC family peroxiredoxin [Bacteroidetes bacterium]|nr:OsmC family peroxiredoxin [Bacteroidota bacterium]